MANVYEVIEKARKTGKIEKGANEATKAAERATAKLIVYAADVEPKQIVQHLPIICAEKNVLCIEADSKKKLGLAAGIAVGCAAVAVIDAGDSEKELVQLKAKK